MADVKYVKIPVDFFEQEPIKTIETMPDSDETILLYLHLLCASYRKSRKGIFSVSKIFLSDDVLAAVFPYDNIGSRIKTLESFGLIKRFRDKVYVFKFWEDAHDRNSVQYRQWRTSVFVRDEFRCQECGSKKDIQAHHIMHWKDHKALRYEVWNGITLCRKCHLKAHGGCWKNG